MATIVAIDCTDGVLLAGDRQVVEDGTVTGSRRHVFDLDGVLAAAVGGDPDAFRRQLETAMADYGADRGEPDVDAVVRMAESAAEEAGVEALIAARDGAGVARVRSIRDGVLDEDVAALGSGAPSILGLLETIGEVDLGDAEAEVERAFEAAAARDPGTGEEVDVSRLSDAEGGETV